MDNLTNANTGSQAAQYLYCWTRNGELATDVPEPIMLASPDEEDTKYPQWRLVCSLPEALAAPKMRGALEPLARVKLDASATETGMRCTECHCPVAPEFYCGCDPDDDPVIHERVIAGREALAACGPDYTPATDPRDEEIKRLREALRTSVDLLENYTGCSDGCTCGSGWNHVERHQMDPLRAALRGDK